MLSKRQIPLMHPCLCNWSFTKLRICSLKSRCELHPQKCSKMNLPTAELVSPWLVSVLSCPVTAGLHLLPSTARIKPRRKQILRQTGSESKYQSLWTSVLGLNLPKYLWNAFPNYVPSTGKNIKGSWRYLADSFRYLQTLLILFSCSSVCS